MAIKPDQVSKLFGQKVIFKRKYYNPNTGTIDNQIATGTIVFINHSASVHFNEIAGRDVPGQVLNTEVKLDNGIEIYLDYGSYDEVQLFPATELGKAIFGD